MKKGLGIILICLSFSFLTSCTPPMYQMKYDMFDGKVEEIKLIKYDNDESKYVNKKSDILPYDFNKEKTIKNLDKSKYEPFLKQLCKNNWENDGEFPSFYNSPKGLSIKITFFDKNFMIISELESRFTAKYTKDGKFDNLIISMEEWGQNSMDSLNLIGKYFFMRMKNEK